MSSSGDPPDRPPEEGKRITVRDIAEVAGVSHSTVSRALKDSALVRADTRQRIKEIAEKMGYRDDPMLSALTAYRAKGEAPRQVNTLAFIVAPFVVESWQDIIVGAQERAEQLGFDLQLHLWSPHIPAQRQVETLRAKGVRGVLVGPTIKTKGDIPIPEELDTFCIVAIGRFSTNFSVNTIAPDHFGSVRLAIEKLRAAGYRRIGLALLDRLNTHVGDRIRAAYLGYLATVPEEERIEPYLPAEEATETVDIEAWIKRVRPDAFLSYTHVYTHLCERGMRIPGDVAFAALNINRQYEGLVAGTNVNNPLVGRFAVNLLNNQLMIGEMGERESRQSIVVDTFWQDGPSAPPCPPKPTAYP